MWASNSEKPIVLMIDEIDALVGDTLVSVLRQLREGYDSRPNFFPQSVILCGVRDVRDYRIQTSNQEIVTGGSTFNVRAKSLRIGDFSQGELIELYGQHTTETGQVFTKEALALAWHLTAGQPWLVNALACEVTHEMTRFRDRSRPITAEALDEAKERIILRRETHLDQLVDKLKEARVHAVIAPMLDGHTRLNQQSSDDLEYVIDLGLIRRTPDGPDIANEIYREVIPRELTSITQEDIASRVPRQPFLKEHGKLDFPELLKAFQQFFRENSEHWLGRFDYQEAGPQLLLQAFLQRIVNGGGRIDRKYGLGRGRTDLFVRWPTTDQGFWGPLQTAVIELKVLHGALETTIAAGLKQTAAYLARVGKTEGHLVIFDRRPDITWDEKIFVRQESFDGATITVWGM
jgi:hypothetical protein